ncbi:MAG: MFS transporter [Anaerolineales bacterium]|nr:MFS transporter [Anaerolineales bacterium]
MFHPGRVHCSCDGWFAGHQPQLVCPDHPSGKQAEYYSFYEVSERGTSWIGPLLFGLVNQIFGSLRPAILSLIFFFVVGLAILPFVNVKKAMADVKNFENS